MRKLPVTIYSIHKIVSAVFPANNEPNPTGSKFHIHFVRISLIPELWRLSKNDLYANGRRIYVHELYNTFIRYVTEFNEVDLHPHISHSNVSEGIVVLPELHILWTRGLWLVLSSPSQSRVTCKSDLDLELVLGLLAPPVSRTDGFCIWGP